MSCHLEYFDSICQQLDYPVGDDFMSKWLRSTLVEKEPVPQRQEYPESFYTLRKVLTLISSILYDFILVDDLYLLLGDHELKRLGGDEVIGW